MELNHQPGAVSLDLDDVPAGGPYGLAVSATTPQGAACQGSSPQFFVPAGATVLVLESLICAGDAGLSPTLLDPAAAR